MQSKLSPKDFVYYELNEDSGYSFHFFTYKTPDGKIKGVKESEADNGSIRYKSFVFDRGVKMPVHKTNTEYVKFLDEHPNNPASPYFTGVAKFKRFEPEVINRSVIESESRRAAAITEAVNLKGVRLYEVAALLGFFFTAEEEGSAIRALVERAKADPAAFMLILQTPHKESKLRRIVKAAIHGGVIRKENEVYRFGDVTLGVDESSVVAMLANDADLTSLLDRRLDLYQEEEPAPSEQKTPVRAAPPKAGK